jgi:hypothetical protein
MTVGTGTAGHYSPPGKLSFSSTVNRDIVHRYAVSEVFVTDVRRTGETRAVAAVQLPLTNSYYNDHVQHPLLFDPLLILECCRQSAICAAHVGEVPIGTAMLVGSFALQLESLGALAVGRVPGELEIDSLFFPEVSRAGTLKGSSVTQTLSAGGTKVGSHQMVIRILTQRSHDALRRMQRGSPAPSTADYDGRITPGQVEPEQVGRVHLANVVLSQLDSTGGQIRAQVTPRFDNRSLFDHDYDHLPAMTLVEAARQVALIATATATGSDTGRIFGSALRAEFRRFAEIDEPLVARAALPAVTPDHPGAKVSVAFSQRGQTIADVSVDSVLSLQGT